MADAEPSRSIVIIAGETSGDAHGAQLVRAMQQRRQGLFFCGIGGERLQAAGVDILMDLHQLSVVGITEVAAKIPRVLTAVSAVKRSLDRLQPDLVVLIDFEWNDKPREARRQNESSALFNAIKMSLRRGDVFARYSPSQFIVLLMDINHENSKKVIGRISDNFYKQTKSRKITCKVSSAIEPDRMLSSDETEKTEDEQSVVI